MRLAIALFLVLLPFSVEARTSPYPPPTPFEGDRYSARQAQMDADVARAVRSQRQAKRNRKHRREKAGHVSRERAPVVRQIALPEGMTREVRRAASGRPRAWCGWWLGHHLGMPLRRLWLARNWASVGSNAGGPGIGTVVVWRHHVGIITGHGPKGWIVKSGNDGHAVRERPRSVAHAIAFRRVS